MIFHIVDIDHEIHFIPSEQVEYHEPTPHCYCEPELCVHRSYPHPFPPILKIIHNELEIIE